MTWTPKMQELLEQLAGEGLSCLQIGQSLGVSKNAVIGRGRRTGVRFGFGKSKRKLTANLPRARRGVTQISLPAPMPVMRPEPIVYPASIHVEGGVDIDDLGPRDCKWPVASNGTHHKFCGCDRFAGSPNYCVLHAEQSVSIQSRGEWRRRMEMEGHRICGERLGEKRDD